MAVLKSKKDTALTVVQDEEALARQAAEEADMAEMLELKKVSSGRTIPEEWLCGPFASARRCDRFHPRDQHPAPCSQPKHVVYGKPMASSV